MERQPKKLLWSVARVLLAALLVGWVLRQARWGDALQAPPHARAVPIAAVRDDGAFVLRARGAERIVPREAVERGEAVYVRGIRSIALRLAGRWWWALAALGAMLLQSPIGAVRWRLLLRVQGVRLTFLESLRLTYIGWFFNNWMPGATGGDVVKAYYIARRTHRKAEAVTAVFLDRFVGLVSLCLLGAAGACLSLGDPRLRRAQVLLAAILAAMIAAAAILYVGPVRRWVCLDRLLARLRRESLPARVNEALLAYRRHQGTVLAALALGWAVQAASIVAVWWAALGLGSRADWHHYFVNLPVIWVGWSVAPVPGGFGVAEGLAQALFSPAVLGGAAPLPASEAATLALAMILCYRLLQMIVSLPGLVLYLARRTEVSPTHAREALAEAGTRDPDSGGPSVPGRPLEAAPAGRSAPAAPPPGPTPFSYEYVGALHIHSCYSDGSGTPRQILRAARRAGLDFFVLTDHDTLGPSADGWPGWHDGVLMVAGVEITCKQHCHVVALGPRDVSSLRWKPLRRVLFDLKNQGALALVAHAHPARVFGWPMKAGALNEWEVPGFTGVELWSFMHDICDGLAPWRVPAFLVNWRERARGPAAETLAHYDAITQKRRFAAVGSIDNHGWPPLPVFWPRLIPYEAGFRTLRTHVLADELTGAAEDLARVVGALAEGRAFMALETEADARGFRFEAVRERATPLYLLMGQEHLWDGPVDLVVRSPRAARLRLLRNGQLYAETEGTDLRVRAEGPGVYRVEALLEAGKTRGVAFPMGSKGAPREGHPGTLSPWVFTNPIYLRPEGWRDGA